MRETLPLDIRGPGWPALLDVSSGPPRNEQASVPCPSPTPWSHPERAPALLSHVGEDKVDSRPARGRGMAERCFQAALLSGVPFGSVKPARVMTPQSVLPRMYLTSPRRRQ